MPDKAAVSKGFTIVEVLVVAPMMILIVVGFIALIVNLTGSVLQSKEASNVTYETQSALDQIEYDTRTAIGFSTVSLVPLTGQGMDNADAIWNSAASVQPIFILNSLATNKNPIDKTRKLVNQQAGSAPCSTTSNPFAYNIIYYTKTTGDNTELWRRVLVPNYDPLRLCGEEPWQLRTCTPTSGFTPTTNCQAEDTKMLSHVSQWSVSYFEKPNSTTPIVATRASEAYTAEILLGIHKTVAGRDIDHSGSLRVTRVNDREVTNDQPPAGAGHTIVYSMLSGALSGTQSALSLPNPYANGFAGQDGYDLWACSGSSTCNPARMLRGLDPTANLQFLGVEPYGTYNHPISAGTTWRYMLVGYDCYDTAGSVCSTSNIITVTRL